MTPGKEGASAPSCVQIRAFRPEIPPSLRKKVQTYAKAKGRTMTNALHWLVRMALKAEGY